MFQVFFGPSALNPNSINKSCLSKRFENYVKYKLQALQNFGNVSIDTDAAKSLKKDENFLKSLVI